MVEKVLAAVKEKLRPTAKEGQALAAAANNFMANLNRQLPAGRAILGGSGKKGTWVHLNHDIDVFVQFPYSKFQSRGSELADLLEPALRKAFGKVTRLHGSRDYFQLQQGRYRFEIVPILNVSSAAQAKNITDISPLHSDWVKKREKGHADDIRLMKQFCRAHGIYGAESHIRGFSGYGCEILVIHYGSFLKLLRASQKWKKQQVIDAENHYRRENALLAMNRSKLSPVILVDPVQKERNVLAALGEEQRDVFVKAAAAFLKKPSPEFFVKKEVDVNMLKKQLRQKGVIIAAVPLQRKEDIAGSKMRKAAAFIERELQKAGFRVRKSGWHWDAKESLLWFVTDTSTLPAYQLVAGPPIADVNNAARFRQRHRSVLVKNRRLHAKKPAKRRKLGEVVQFLLKSPYVAEKVKSSRVV